MDGGAMEESIGEYVGHSLLNNRRQSVHIAMYACVCVCECVALCVG